MSATGAEIATAATATRRVFISYSRIDGRESAHRLRDILTAASHDVWLDTDRIGDGASWSKVTEDVLNQPELILTDLLFIDLLFKCFRK